MKMVYTKGQIAVLIARDMNQKLVDNNIDADTIEFMDIYGHKSDFSFVEVEVQ